MIVRILDFCLRERLVVLLAAAALAAYGWYATKTVPLDAIPDIGAVSYTHLRAHET